MTGPIEIAPSTEADLRQLYGLARETFANLAGWSDERALDVLERDVVFVARELEHLAGYVALRTEPATATVVIDQLFVAPGHEHRGIGRRLLAFAEGWAIAAGMNALRIVAEQTNWRARSFYRRSGFAPVEPELLELVLPRTN
jgi:ribosomal protein S18 acetylase RimI-like enzyme